MSEKCGNCVWFKGEPATPINLNAPVVQEQEAKQTLSQKLALRGGQ